MKFNSGEMPVSALLVGEFADERLLLCEIFRNCGWRLFEASDRRRALQALERNPVRVVITETSLPSGDWRKVLRDLRKLPVPPQLVVTSRLADDHLWAEVLNIGGFDVLARPLDRDEVERVVASASRHFETRHLREARPAIQTASVA
jgi:DNA-binding response OmpR family regulator